MWDAGVAYRDVNGQLKTVPGLTSPKHGTLSGLPQYTCVDGGLVQPDGWPVLYIASCSPLDSSDNDEPQRSSIMKTRLFSTAAVLATLASSQVASASLPPSSTTPRQLQVSLGSYSSVELDPALGPALDSHLSGIVASGNLTRGAVLEVAHRLPELHVSAGRAATYPGAHPAFTSGSRIGPRSVWSRRVKARRSVRSRESAAKKRGQLPPHAPRSAVNSPAPEL